MKNHVSMRDIAMSMNVSTVTVSKALSGKEGVSVDLRSKILAEADKLGYRKNIAASDMRQGMSSNIGIIAGEQYLESKQGVFLLIQELIKNISNSGYYGIEEIIQKDKLQKGILPNIVKMNKVEGIIVLGFMRPVYLAKIEKTGIPVLSVDSSFATNSCDAIICDNVYGSYILTRHLISLMHERIAFVGNPLFEDNTMDRYLGYLKAMKERGLHDLPPINDVDELGSELIISLPNPMPTAFACASSRTAFNLQKQILSAGHAVPDDISLVCFDDDVFAQIASPAITSFNIDYKEMAYLATVTIIQKINEQEHIGRKTVSGELVIRKSTARVNIPFIDHIRKLG